MIVLQPLQVNAYAQLHLRRAKNDRLDAALIAACTQVIDSGHRIEPDPRFDLLADHLTYIEQIEDDIAGSTPASAHRGPALAARDRRRHCPPREAPRRRVEALDRRTAPARRSGQRLALVLSIPGIGARTALALIVRMPELGQLSREQAAALAGLAPFVHSSGKRQGETHIAGGRARLRRSLYAALPAAFRWNPALVALYRRLTGRGKTHKSALVACARKLLVFANTVIRRGAPWTELAQAA